jgi:hypothetical protein
MVTRSVGTAERSASKGKLMDDDFSKMSDPDFLEERRRVREAIDALQERYQLINKEFDRRAAAKWRETS